MAPPKKPRRLYSRFVDLLIHCDRAIAEAQEDLLAADPANDEARRQESRFIKLLQEHRRFLEDRMRKIEPGVR